MIQLTVFLSSSDSNLQRVEMHPHDCFHLLSCCYLTCHDFLFTGQYERDGPTHDICADWNGDILHSDILR